MLSDPVSDMLAQIKNAVLARKKTIVMPYSKLKEAIFRTLLKEGYIESFAKIGEGPKYSLEIQLKYQDKQSIITDIKRKSKPGLRVYVNKSSIPEVVGGMGIAILSTSQGVMTGQEARKRGLGGELLCVIW